MGPRRDRLRRRSAALFSSRWDLSLGNVQPLCRRCGGLGSWNGIGAPGRFEELGAGNRGEPPMPRLPPRASSGPAESPWILCRLRSPATCGGGDRKPTRHSLTAAGAPAAPLAAQLSSLSLSLGLAGLVEPACGCAQDASRSNSCAGCVSDAQIMIITG